MLLCKQSLKKDKKGFELLNSTLTTVLAVMGIVILCLIIGKLVYGFFTNKSDIQKAEETLNLIDSKLEFFNKTNINNDNLLIYPPSGWYLRSFTQDIPTGECKNKKYCFCICDNYKCNSQKKCQGYDNLIYTSHGESKYSGVIPLENSVEELLLNKESKNIFISLKIK